MKKVIISLLILFLLAGIGLGVWYYFMPMEIENVEYFVEGETIKASVHVKNVRKTSYCIVLNQSYLVEDDSCTFEIPNEETKLIVQNSSQKVEKMLFPNVSQVVDIALSHERVYLVLEEEKEITFSLKKLGNPKEDIVLLSRDENIATTKDNKIIGVSSGNTIVDAKVGDITKSIEVVVTDLVTKPVWKGQDKPKLTCNVYSEEQAKLLDELLAYRVNEAGYQTRAGAVAAARFLTLEFPYRVPYFYENGRLDPKTAVHIVDGEGRYYKQGLYLSESKFDSISSTWKGPAIWGCPLMNLEDDPESNYYPGQMRGNGLDCSGFVSWTLVNGGFDPGDVGAGENPGIYQLTDTGEYMHLTPELINSGRIKVGDLFNYWGHISILVGMTDEYFYIAESLQYKNFDGATVKQYKKSNVMNTFEYIVLMDSFYKEDGNYTEYWE